MGWNNKDKTPVFHYMTAFTGETAPTAEKAMELTMDKESGFLKDGQMTLRE